MNSLIHPFDPDRHEKFLSDESWRRGRAHSISFPADEAALRQVVKQICTYKRPVTVQGSRTGIAGNAVPGAGHILNLSAMNRITGMAVTAAGGYCLRVQPGVLLADLNRQTASRRFEHAGRWDPASINALARFQDEDPGWFWPPDPTEDAASVGGMAATDARGICACYYGTARQHIQAVRFVDPRGRVHAVARGQYRADPASRPLPWRNFEETQTPSDPNEAPDLLDLLLGSDGRIGVISEVTLRLCPVPPQMWGILFFFTGLSQAAGFTDFLASKKGPESGTWIAGVALMDPVTLDAIDTLKNEVSAFRHLPRIPEKAAGAVYLELHGDRESAVADLAQEAMDAAADFGCDPEDTRAATSVADLPRVRLFRQAAPRAVDHLAARARQSDHRLVRLGTDLVLSGAPLADQIRRYQADMAQAGIPGAIFGHGSDRHLHVTLLPENLGQFVKGDALIRQWAGRFREQGGRLPAYSGWQARIKNVLDPDNRWQPGSLPDA
jgi:D-lactate dehydrogenase (cytochrome)